MRSSDRAFVVSSQSQSPDGISAYRLANLSIDRRRGVRPRRRSFPDITSSDDSRS
jgi:hypothetical protein